MGESASMSGAAHCLWGVLSSKQEMSGLLKMYTAEAIHMAGEISTID